MMEKKSFFKALIFIPFSFLTACNSSEEKTKTVSTDSIVSIPPSNHQQKDSVPVSAELLIIKAQFVDFSLGDASHFIFKDESGKEWDFADSEDSTQKFAVELPPAKSNTKNQGWSSNKELKGRWFNIKYKFVEQPQYQDGPMAKMPVIVEATPVN